MGRAGPGRGARGREGARGPGWGAPATYLKGAPGPSGAASSCPRPPSETRIRGSQGCTRVSPARASQGARRASEARPWAATQSRCQEPLPGTEPGERASELRRGTGWGSGGGRRGDCRALPAQMAGSTGNFLATAGPSGRSALQIPRGPRLREGDPKVATYHWPPATSRAPCKWPVFREKFGEEEADIHGAPTGCQEGSRSILITTLLGLV